MNKFYKALIFFNIILFLFGNIFAYMAYDYFYDLETQKCNKILNLDYAVGTEQTSMCLSYGISEFWNYTIIYHILANLLIFIISIIPSVILLWKGEYYYE